MARDDFFASPFGAVYSAYMERPALARLVSRIVWGGSIASYYDSMDAVAEVAERRGAIVDCPCGAGPAFRALPLGGGARYVAADLSPSMLEKARQRARARDLPDVEFLRADATDLPLADDSADLFLSYWGLHCFDDPEAALVESARVLRPRGRLVGSCFVRGGRDLRQRLLVRPGLGGFGRIGTQSEVESWLATSGFQERSAIRSGPMLFFEARLPG